MEKEISDADKDSGRVRGEAECLAEVTMRTSLYGIIVVNEEGIIETINPAAERMFGFSPGEAVNNNMNILMPEPYRSEHGSYVAKFITTGAKRMIGKQREVLGRKKDGTLFPIELGISEIFVGEKRKFSAMIRDVSLVYSARKKAEEENYAKSRFLTHMAHELRTPLSGVIGLLDLVSANNTSNSSMSVTDRGYISLAREASTSLLHILNDILDLSRIEAGELRLETSSFSPRAVATDAIKLFFFQAERKGVGLALHANPGVPPSLLGDCVRFRQILMNLVANAVKFTEAGEITVSLYGNTIDQATYELHVEVKDTGIGMSEETVEKKLFRSFTQADSSVSRRYGGTGLGLFICKQLCTLMRGEISATSQLGKGSTFHFWIPFTLSSQAPKDREEEEGRAKASSAAECVLPSSLRVLLAEDNSINQLVLKTMLEKSGCSHVSIAHNGAEAVDMAKNNTYDIILMDEQMPVMNGTEAAQKIRNTLSLTLPIVLVTASFVPGRRKEEIPEGMQAMLVKPVSRHELVRVINNCIDTKEP